MKHKAELQDAPLNKYAFADQRHELIGVEPDNKTEQELFQAIRDHITDNAKIDRQKADLIIKILSNRQYEDVFVRPKTEVVYRGMSVSIMYIEKLLSREQIKKLHDTGKLSLDGNFMYTPRKGVSSSWTKTKTIASKFAKSWSKERYSVLLSALTEENDARLFDLKNVYSIGTKLRAFTIEDEIMSLGQIRVNNILLTTNHKKDLTNKQKKYVYMTEEQAKVQIKEWINAINQRMFDEDLYEFINSVKHYYLEYVKNMQMSESLKSKIRKLFEKNGKDISDFKMEYNWSVGAELDKLYRDQFIKELKLFLSKLNRSYSTWVKRLMHPSDSDVDLAKLLAKAAVKSINLSQEDEDKLAEKIYMKTLSYK
jgi:hypothetical protein